MAKPNSLSLLYVFLLFLIGTASCLPQSAPVMTPPESTATSTQLPLPIEEPATIPPVATEAPEIIETSTRISNEETNGVLREETPVLVTVKAPQLERVEMTPEPTIPPPADPAVQKWIDDSKEDLAGRLNISIDQIDLVAFELVFWPDAGLGCPAPGMLYAQVPVDGFLIRFSVGGKPYNYHGGGNRGPFLCEQTVRVIKSTPIVLDGLQPPPGNADD